MSTAASAKSRPHDSVMPSLVEQPIEARQKQAKVEQTLEPLQAALQSSVAQLDIQLEQYRNIGPTSEAGSEAVTYLSVAQGAANAANAEVPP